MLNTVILSIPTGTLSVGNKRVLHGDKTLALAAHDYYEQFGREDGDISSVQKIMPSNAKRGFNSRNYQTKTQKIVAYAIRDVDALMRWWHLEN